MVEKLVEIGILFDFYGKLLSRRQGYIIELFYIHDLSLTEIGEEIGITKQGVYDTLKRGESNLYKYEDKLGLVKKFKNNQYGMENVIKLANEIKTIIELTNNNIGQDILLKTKLIEDICLKILKNS